MKDQSVKIFLVLGLVASAATPGFGQVSPTEHISVKCETVNGVPTTVAHSSKGSQAVFHWHQKYLPASVNANNLCQDVSKRLETNLNSGDQNRPSTYSFATDVKVGIPTVCWQNAPDQCKEVLFTLPAMPDKSKGELYEVNNLLFNIIDDSFKVADATPVREGYLKARYRVPSRGLWPFGR